MTAAPPIETPIICVVLRRGFEANPSEDADAAAVVDEAEAVPKEEKGEVLDGIGGGDWVSKIMLWSVVGVDLENDVVDLVRELEMVLVEVARKIVEGFDIEASIVAWVAGTALSTRSHKSYTLFRSETVASEQTEATQRSAPSPSVKPVLL